jgi:hypothetical protein
VSSLEALRGQPCSVPLLQYGVTSTLSGSRQWVLVFPRYAASLREWRLKWRGRGLQQQDLAVYLGLFLQVRSRRRVSKRLGLSLPACVLRLVWGNALGRQNKVGIAHSQRPRAIGVVPLAVPAGVL